MAYNTYNPKEDFLKTSEKHHLNLPLILQWKVILNSDLLITINMRLQEYISSVIEARELTASISFSDSLCHNTVKG